MLVVVPPHYSFGVELTRELAVTIRMDSTSQDYLAIPHPELSSSGPVVQVKFPIIGRIWITTTQEAMSLQARSLPVEDGNIERRVHLSESRAYDGALDILGAHKLTSNFHLNLELVLKNLGVRQGHIRGRAEVQVALLPGLSSRRVPA